jgi:hypothetical protein
VKLEAFQSDKGDCLLLTAGDGTRVLVDGGMRGSYSKHVAPALGAIAAAGGRLDLVCVSHIDQDHIAGVLQLMADAVAWRVADFQHGSGNAGFPEPANPRPPAVARVWHNGFHDVVGDNAGPITDALAASAAVLEPGEGERVTAALQRGLATSIAEGLQLSARLAPEQLGIPLNREFGGKLAMVRPRRRTVRLGAGLRLTLLGPFEEDLERFRGRWNDWLAENGESVERLRARMQEDAERLATGEIDAFRRGLAVRADELGRRTSVTVENLVSIMLLAEEDGHRVLLTGDGHGADVLRGLERARKLDRSGRIHVDVLKVPHHGSEHNLDADFAARVTADHYVFCANGEHANPDLRIVRALFDARDAEGAGGPPFTFWFNSSSTASEDAKGRMHMAEVEALVGQLEGRARGRMASRFLADSSFEVG